MVKIAAFAVLAIVLATDASAAGSVWMRGQLREMRMQETMMRACAHHRAFARRLHAQAYSGCRWY